MFVRRWFQGFAPLCIASALTLSLATALIGCGNPQGLDSIAISPASQALAVGQTAQFLAVGTFGNANHSTTSNVTSGVTWTSSAPAVATVNSSGLATAVGAGTTTITANAQAYNGSATSTATLTVTGSSGGTAGGTVTSISIVPGSQSVSASQTTQFLAIGTTSSGATVSLTNQVAWTSSSPQIATIGATTGLASALGQGTVAITAIYTNPSGGSVVTANANLTVTASSGGAASGTVTSISIVPSSQSVSAPQTTQFLAIGTTSSGATVDLTNQVKWGSSTQQIATIVQTGGLATGISQGSDTITAIYTSPSGGSVVTASANLTVTGSSGGAAAGTVVSIAIIPASQAVATPGQTTQFLAIGTTSSGATVDLTNQVKWGSSTQQIATIFQTGGLATAVGKGTDTITAIYANPSGGTVVTGSATFTVSGGTTQQYTGISITPSSQTVSASGQTTQLVALGTSGSTGLLSDVTKSSQVTWTSTIPSIATVSATGLVTGVSAGTDNITAVLTNSDGSVVTNTATITVISTPAPEPLLSLTIIPSSITVGNLQDTGQFLAIGTFSTVPYVRDLTNSPTLTWISATPSVFPVNTNSGGTPGATAGIVTAYGNGSGVIIAEAMSTDGTIQTATATFNCPLAAPSGPNTGTCYPGSQAPALLATLTLYNEGLNTTNWLVTAPAAFALSTDPPVIHCGPGSTSGGSVCVSTYPMGTSVLLTAPAQPGVKFGGWSYNCTPTDVNGVPLVAPQGPTEAGPNYCKITFANLNTNVTVGAIFN